MSEPTPVQHPRSDWPDELLNARVRFWRCLNRDHKSVTWEGDVATCPDCGLTSDMTQAYAQGVRTRYREQVEREVRVGELRAVAAEMDGGAAVWVTADWLEERAEKISRGEA